jgi:hypothetical protein
MELKIFNSKLSKWETLTCWWRSMTNGTCQSWRMFWMFQSWERAFSWLNEPSRQVQHHPYNKCMLINAQGNNCDGRFNNWWHLHISPQTTPTQGLFGWC